MRHHLPKEPGDSDLIIQLKNYLECSPQLGHHMLMDLVRRVKDLETCKKLLKEDVSECTDDHSHRIAEMVKAFEQRSNI